jgi:biotin carboxyl carrier protein
VVEAMKMELDIKATVDGVVSAVRCAPGDQVARGQVLVNVDPEPES